MLKVEFLILNEMSYLKVFIISLLLICFFIQEMNAQQAGIVFYNVENLFDIYDDSLTRDEEFLPEGEKHWTYDRFNRKLLRIYKTLVAAGAGEMPAVVGLCEIENREVLDKLVFNTPLEKLNYRIIHRESQDARGVDVALLYRPDVFLPDTAQWLKVPLEFNETTREILHVSGKFWNEESIHFYVNHWPSRYGGAGSSGRKRIAAASILAASVKELLTCNPEENIVIMGDFNDEPRDESILTMNKILANNPDGDNMALVNLSEKKALTNKEGTIKHQGLWCIFDQIIVSKALTEGAGGLRVTEEQASTFRLKFLLEPDETYSGEKPFRTYTGPGYHDGFSDHLPVGITVLKFNNPGDYFSDN